MKPTEAIHNSPDLPFNPTVLKWARERLALEKRVVAKKVRVKADRLDEWETGTRAPTVRQGRELAKIYHRPFLEFFYSSIPELPEIELIPDLRHGEDESGTKPEVELILTQQWAREIRTNALDLLEEIGDTELAQTSLPHFTLNDDVVTSAKKARDSLLLPIDVQIGFPETPIVALSDILRDFIECVDILILKDDCLHKLNVRGLCIYSQQMPIIVIGNELPSTQAFTIVHEFAHVLLQQSAVSGFAESRSNSSEYAQQVEEWCDQFTASFLMPEIELQKYARNPDDFSDEHGLSQVIELSQIFKVSEYAMFNRLMELNYIEDSVYWDTLRPIMLQEEQILDSVPRQSLYNNSYIDKLGRFYTGTVLDAWNTGYITTTNAADYLGVTNLQHLFDIQSDL